MFCAVRFPRGTAQRPCAFRPSTSSPPPVPRNEFLVGAGKCKTQTAFVNPQSVFPFSFAVLLQLCACRQPTPASAVALVRASCALHAYPDHTAVVVATHPLFDSSNHLATVFDLP